MHHQKQGWQCRREVMEARLGQQASLCVTLSSKPGDGEDGK